MISNDHLESILQKQQAPALQEEDSDINTDCACPLKTETPDNLDVCESNQALSIQGAELESGLS